MKQQPDLQVVRGWIDGISWVFAVGPTGEPYPTCPKTNQGPPVPQEGVAKPEEFAPVTKAPAGNRKLTWPQVEAIRLLLHCGQSQRQVARLFNVSRGTIAEIAKGITWKDSGEAMEAGPSGELKSKKVKDSSTPEGDGGIWLVTEPVQLPGILLDIPCGMFRSKEQAQAYLREQGERFQLRRIEGDWNQKAKDSDGLRAETQNKGKEKA